MADDVTVHLGVDDEASETVDQLAGQVDRLDGTTAKVGVDADTRDAQRGLDDVAGAVDDVDGTDATVDVQADTSGAQGDLDAVREAASQVDAADPTVDVSVDAASANEALRTLDKQAKKAATTIEKLGSGGKASGNQIADLAGPLGDASGAASVAAGVFDGLGDTFENLGPKLGLTEEVAGSLSQTMGVLGIGVAAGAALWSVYSSRQKKAAEDAAKAKADLDKTADALKNLNQLLDEHKFDDAAAGLLKAFPKLEPAVEGLGVAWTDVWGLIKGDLSETDVFGNLDAQIATIRASFQNLDPDQLIPAQRKADRLEQLKNDILAIAGNSKDAQAQLGLTGTATDQLAAAMGLAAGNAGPAADGIAGVGDAAQTAAPKLDNLSGATNHLKDALDIASDTHDAEQSVRDLSQAMVDYAQAVKDHGKNSQEATDALFNLQGQTIRTKEDLLDFANSLGKLPPSVETKVKAAIERGDVTEAYRILADVAKTRQANFQAEADKTEAQKVKEYLDALAKRRDAAIVANPVNITATRDSLDKVSGSRTAPVTAEAHTGQAETDLDALERDRHVNVFVRPVRTAPLPGDPGFSGAGRSAPAMAAMGAAPIGAGGAQGRAAGDPAVPAFPIYGPAAGGVVQVFVDARGAVDPYAVGRRVSEVMGEWRRVAGTWTPGGIR